MIPWLDPLVRLHSDNSRYQSDINIYQSILKLHLPSWRERHLLLRPDEVESCRHTGERRYPVSESNRRLDPGFRRGDEFKHQRAGSIVTPNESAKGVTDISDSSRRNMRLKRMLSSNDSKDRDWLWVRVRHVATKSAFASAMRRFRVTDSESFAAIRPSRMRKCCQRAMPYRKRSADT